MLEIKLAALRDRLYVERMEEAAKEEEMILNGMSLSDLDLPPPWLKSTSLLITRHRHTSGSDVSS